MTVLVYGPQGCGKTRYAEILRKHFSCDSVEDVETTCFRLVEDRLHLTSSQEVFEKAFSDVSVGCWHFADAMNAAGYVQPAHGKAEWVKRGEVLKTTTPELLDERGTNYGKFTTNAGISQALKYVMFNQPVWERMQDDQKEALEMICTKMARLLNGNPDHVDSWVDIAGYSQLVADRLQGNAR